MPHKRLLNFLIVYLLGCGALLAVKGAFGLSDYVIPGPPEILEAARQTLPRYTLACLDTLGVAVVGHLLSIALAVTVGVFGRGDRWPGSFIRSAAYSIQSYPVVVLAPIIFILVGDGVLARLLMASLICYFPLLLSFIGVFSEPVKDIEHFYRSTGKMTWPLEIRIRAFENMEKLTTVISGSATLAMVGTIIAEFIAADAGIGYGIRKSLYQNDLARILVALLLIGIATALYLSLLEWGGRRVVRIWATDRQG